MKKEFEVCVGDVLIYEDKIGDRHKVMVSRVYENSLTVCERGLHRIIKTKITHMKI